MVVQAVGLPVVLRPRRDADRLLNALVVRHEQLRYHHLLSRVQPKNTSTQSMEMSHQKVEETEDI